MISLLVFWKFCSSYLFIYRSNFILASSINWMTSFIYFCFYCSFFSSYLPFSSVLLTSNVDETNGLIIFLIVSNLSLFQKYDRIQHHLPRTLEIQEHHKLSQVCDPFPTWFEKLRNMFLNNLYFRSGDTYSLCFLNCI